MSSKRAFFFSALSSHTSIVPGNKRCSTNLNRGPKGHSACPQVVSILPPIQTMYTCQDKNQKLFVSSFCKRKHKKRNIQGVSCLCGAAFIVNPNPLCSSRRNLRIVSKGQVLKSRLSKDLLEKNVQRFNCNLSVFILKGSAERLMLPWK